MASSITETISAATLKPANLSLTLKMTGIESVKKRISALVAEMLSPNVFPPQLQTLIKTWESNYYEKHLKSLSEQSNRFKASLGLCFLLYKIIYPTLSRCEKDSVKQRAVQKFEEELVNILESILPKGKSAEVFLEEYEREFQKERLHHAKLTTIHTLFQEQINLLNTFSEATEDKLIEQFEILKKRMLELNANRRSTTEEMNKKLDALTEKVGSIGHSLQDSGADVDKTSEKLQRQQQKFLSILAECQTLLQEI